MSAKDVHGAITRRRKWQIRISLILGAVAVLAICVAVRSLWGPGSASAQAPRLSSQRGAPARTADASNSLNAPGSATSSARLPGNAAQSITTMAVVNGEEITRQELANECLRRYAEDVLESMVNKQLILNACRTRGIVISQKEVNEEVQRIAAKFGMSADRWLQMLADERDIAPEQYSRDIVWPTLALRRLADDKIRVSRDEVNQAIESELGPKVRVRIISVSTLEEAERLHKMAVADPDEFGRLAKQYSEDKTSASAYGFIPPIRRHIGDPTIEKVAFGLKEGDISDVIHVANQYVILKCEKHDPPLTLPVQQVRDAESKIVEHLREKKLREAATDLFAQLQEEVKVVNVYNDPELKTQMPGVAATIDGAPITIRQLSEECISRHGQEVLDGEINRKLLQQELRRRNVTVEPEDIDKEIARAADAYGYWKQDGSPDIEKWLDEVTEQDGATVELYVRDAVWPTVALKKLVSATVKVTEEDLKKGFEANYGERVELLAIVLNSQRQAQKVWEMAQNNPTKEFFGDLAYQYSVDPTSRMNYGKVPPVQQHGGRPQLEKEAFALQAGEISGLIHADGKWVVLYCLGRTKPIVQEFEAVREHLQKDIREKKLRLAMAAEFDRLKEIAQIDNFLAGTSQSGKRAETLPAAGSGADLNGTRLPFVKQ